MSKSLRQYREHLARIVGDGGKVEGFVSPRGERTFVVKCRHCWDKSGKTRMSVRGSRVTEVATAWIQHEATREHRASTTNDTDVV